MGKTIICFHFANSHTQFRIIRLIRIGVKFCDDLLQILMYRIYASIAIWSRHYFHAKRHAVACGDGGLVALAGRLGLLMVGWL